MTYTQSILNRFKEKDIQSLRDYINECDAILAHPDDNDIVDLRVERVDNQGWTMSQFEDHIKAMSGLLTEFEAHPLTIHLYNKFWAEGLDMDNLDEYATDLWEALQDPYSDDWSDFIYEKTVGYDRNIEDLKVHLESVYQIMEDFVEC